MNDNKLVTGTATGDLLVWDLSTGKATQRINVGSSIQQIFVSPDRRQIWCSTLLDGVLALDSSTLSGVVAKFPRASGLALGHGIREDGTYCVLRWTNTFTLGSRPTITLEWWRGNVRMQAASPHQIEKRITSAALSSDTSTILLGTEDGVVHRLLGPQMEEVLST